MKLAKRAPPSRPPFFSIALLSCCVLAYEVLLTRLFSIVLWHHYAYLIISAAMLGLGASGTLLALFKDKIAPYFAVAYLVSATALALLMPAALWLTGQVSFNPLELLWDHTQQARLLAVYLLMMLPFFCGGFCIGLVYAACGRSASKIYASDILGAGAGSLGIILVLYLLTPAKALTVLASLVLCSTAIGAIELRFEKRGLATGFFSLAALALLMPAIALHPSPYKDLSQTLHITGARIVEQNSSPLGLITVVENNQVPLRAAPGMSLNSLSEPPPQLGVYIDGDGPSVLTRFDGRLDALAYLDQLSSALPYPLLAANLINQPHVLVLGAGTGTDVLQALYHNSASVDAVELDSNVTDLVRQRFRDHAGNLYGQPGVQLYQAEARGFVNASRKNYDLIQIALLDSFGSAYGPSANYLYTVEAFQGYLNRLSPGGMLAITRWLTLPPRDALKLFATAAVALEKNGFENPGAKLAMIRGWKTVTLLVKNGDFNAGEITALREFCRTRSFDPAWYPGMDASEANRYNLLAQPYFYDAALALQGPGRQGYIDQYKFYIEPATDDRPYFFRFFKWSSASELFALRAQGGMLDWGYPLLIATLLQAIAASALLIAAPLARSRSTLPSAAMAGYFLAIGFAFMFMEIAFIQKFMLFLAHPLYAVAVVLCAFLVFAALGSRLGESQFVTRVTNQRTENRVALAVAALAGIALLYLAILPMLFQSMVHLPDAAKIALSILLIAPLGICMGVPFPAGIKKLADTAESSIPWAWAINGCASVVGSVLATLLAIHLGFAAVILLAVLIYAAAAYALRA